MRKTEIAVNRIKEFEPPEGYYLAFSGGKDSIVVEKLCQMAEVKYDTHFHVAKGVDHPITIKFIKENYKDVIFDVPELNFYQLILKKKMLPTRKIRFCCSYFKEGNGDGRFKILGLRASESSRRRNRKMIEVCYKTGTKILCPIIDWTHTDVWKFIREYNLPYNPLYDPPYNFQRVGCVGCPMNPKTQKKQFEMFPNFKKAFLTTIKKMCNEGIFKENPEDVFNWWVSGKSRKNYNISKRQLTFYKTTIIGR